ncbi:PRA1 family protein 2 [Eucyclogobius newberryi]|uniref:PRA1 family protein 2 n=1 Tax=Eucyclogobius newberryi TaxID=166745 RepID=UPI003B5C6E91
MAGVRPPPLRTLEDFVLGSARYTLPNVRDVYCWNNRAINNLLYYQSNYLACALGVLLLVGFVRPLQLYMGAVVVSLAFLGFVWAAENQGPVRRFRRNHPAVCVLAVLLLCCLLLTVVGSAAVFLLGIATPILMSLVHASVRLRNLKNKLENKLESIGLKRTPMGLLLEALGQEQEAGS